MKRTILILTALILSSCTAYDMSGVKDKMKNLGKNPCYNAETKKVEIGCKK
jgi:hypothetical protein